MILTNRDLQIILFVHRLEGCVTDHVRQRFFPATARTTVHLRLSPLIANSYLVSKRLPPEERGGSGSAWLTVGPAAMLLLDHYFALSASEKKQLRHNFIMPHWQHEVELRTVRVHLELAVERSGVVVLDDWVTERVLRQRDANAVDPITKHTVHLTPDGLFNLVFGNRPGHRFFVELDRGTAASRQRYLPKLRAYLQRSDSSTVLFVAPDAARVTQLSRWIQHAAYQLDTDPTVFLLTTRGQLSPKSILAAPIWQTVDQDSLALVDRLVPVRQQLPAPHRVSEPPGHDELNLQ